MSEPKIATTREKRVSTRLNDEDFLVVQYNETSADMVVIENKTNAGLTNDYKDANGADRMPTVEEALKEISDRANITGEQFTDLRNDVNTLESTVSGHGTRLGTAETGITNLGTRMSTAEGNISTLQTDVGNAQSKADEAYALAEGKAHSTSYATKDALVTALKAADNAAFKIGDNLFIEAIDTPDYWISEIREAATPDVDQPAEGSNEEFYGYYGISILETQKVDLSPYQTKIDKRINKNINGPDNGEESQFNVVTAINKIYAMASADGTLVNGLILGQIPSATASKLDHEVTFTHRKTSTSDGSNHQIEFYEDKKTNFETNRSTLEFDLRIKDFAVLARNIAEGAVVTRTIKDQNVTTEKIANGAVTTEKLAGGSVDSTKLSPSLGATGIFSMVNVTNGIVTEGGKLIEFGAEGQTKPSDDLQPHGLFFMRVTKPL